MVDESQAGSQPDFRRAIPGNQEKRLGVKTMFKELLCGLWQDESGQDIAEYAVMLAVILVIVVGTIRLIGSNSNNVFSSVASSIQ
jgi:Flp pilus assembly pilin Flp